MVAAAVIGGAVLGAGASVYAGSKSAGAAKDAAQTTTDENQREFDLVRGDTAPTRALGANATAALSRLYGYGAPQVDPATGAMTAGPQGTPDMSGFFTSPDYTFNLAQGQKAIDNSLVAQGRGLSGAAVKAGTQYASGLASQQYGDYVNRLMAQAGLGTTGVGQSAAAGTTLVGNETMANTNLANARASAYGTIASGVNNSIQGGAGNYLLYKYLNPSTSAPISV